MYIWRMHLVPITTSMDGSQMLIGEPLPFIKNYVEKLNDAIKASCPEKGLTRIQAR